MAHIDEILSRLAIADDHGFVRDLTDDNHWRELVPYRLQKGIEKIAPDALYARDGKLVILFFDLAGHPRSKQDLSQKIWNLGGAPIIYFIEESDVQILNGYIFDVTSREFSRLQTGTTQVHELNYWDIVSGKLWLSITNPRNDSHVDEYLLGNIQTAQKLLTDTGLSSSIANNVIGRLLFCRYLIDRQVILGDGYPSDRDEFLDIIRNKTTLYSFFTYLKNQFHGDLFPVTNTETAAITGEHLTILYRLFHGDELSTGQQSLFDYYDFQIIPVELVSEVYERFMGAENQRSEGAYYTPSFLADYILAKTVRKHLEASRVCCVLDPSCGSGIFLVESLRSLIEKLKKEEPSFTKEQLKACLTENIFGVDKDENAVNLTIFSLYLTLLDYQEPRDITSFQLPDIKNKNIFAADFFDEDASYNDRFSEVEFDYIIGNPPWKSESGVDHHSRYYESRNLPISDKQIAQTFTLRIGDFVSSTTSIAFVLTSKLLYNSNAYEYRRYLLNHYAIEEILELSPVRTQVFNRANAPSFVMFYRPADEQTAHDQRVLHTSLKPNMFLKHIKSIVIEHSDRKIIRQKFFIDCDWLWKVMLYGNVFDFNFLQRLKEDYPSLNKVIADNQLAVGQGVQIGGGDSRDASHLLGKKYLDVSRSSKALEKFYVKDNVLAEWTIPSLHRTRSPELFSGPYVLLKKGPDMTDFSAISAYSENDYVFTDAVTAIKGGLGKKKILQNISAYLNSSYSSYFNLLQGSSIGVERGQGHNEDDRFNMPLHITSGIATITHDLHEAKQSIRASEFYNATLEHNYDKLYSKLNKRIYTVLHVQKAEKALIDYALEITIPLVRNSEAPYGPADDTVLQHYAELFLENFSRFWNAQNSLAIKASIYRNQYVVGMNFTVINNTRGPSVNFVNTSSDSEIHDGLANLMNIAHESVTDKVFIQKDVRGLNRESFYIVKPNEKKNWHAAVALSDIADFMDAMVKQGGRS